MDPKNRDDFIRFREAVRQREKQQRAYRLWFATLAAVLASAGVALSVGQFFDLLKDKPASSITDQTPQILVLHRRQIDALKTEIDDLRKIIAAKPAVVAGDALAAEQARASAFAQKLDSRLTALESAILDSPEKALSLPLIRKDITEAIRRAEESRLVGKAEVDRLYEQQKWMLGGIGAALFAVAGGSITIVLKSLPRGGKANEEGA